MKHLLYLVVLLFATSAFAQNPETDIVTNVGSMIKQQDGSYKITATVTMKKAVDILVDATIKAKVPEQKFDKFTITYDGTVYTIVDKQPFYSSSSIADIKKELKRITKLALDNL